MSFTQHELKTYIRDAAKELHAQTAWLFGSYARGDAREDSDVDVLFIMDSDLPRPQRSMNAYTLLSKLDCPKDVLVYTPDEFRAWKQVPGSLCYNVLHEGIEII
ncbi:MAG: nucleotidyltransferase domain-containing protein [Mariprofundaceae bacterium]|nr:nucleotidyltransferase domain-containing protein [Mariprofundaceae bacterium]